MKFGLSIAAILLAAGCAGYDGRGLVPGQSSAAEVEALMGPASDTRKAANGETVRYYSRLPAGRDMYAARIGPDGRLIAIEQRLTEEYVAKLRPGSSRADDVRDVLGPPYRVDAFPRLEREIWTYPAHGLTTDKLLIVQLSGDGVLREVFMMDDPQAIAKTYE